MSETPEMSETLQDLSFACSSDIVFCDLGEDVVLSCQLRPAISAASMEIKWHKRADLVCHYKDGQMTVSESYEGRVSLSLQDLHNGNVSLTLRDVRTSQMGLYTCEVIHEKQSMKEYVYLFIRHFSLVIPNGTVSAAAGEDVILPLHLSPETSAESMNIRWFRGTEIIYQYINGMETTNNDYENRVSLSIQELKRGNLSLTLKSVQHSDSGEYICKVIHDGSEQTRQVHLHVTGETQLEREIKKLKLDGQIKELEMEKQIKKLKLEKQIVELEMEKQINKLKLDKQIMELEMERERENPLHTQTLHGPTHERRGSLEGNPPRMSDDSTPKMAEPADKRETGVKIQTPRYIVRPSPTRRKPSMQAEPADKRETGVKTVEMPLQPKRLTAVEVPIKLKEGWSSSD